MERAYDRAPAAPIRRTSVATDTIGAVLSEIGPAALGIYVYLARRCNRDGTCWPSYETIAEDCNVQRRYAMKVIADLERGGFLMVERRRSERTGNLENVYHLPAQSALFGGVHPDVHPGDHPGDLHIRKKVKSEATEEATEEGHAPRFAEFWLAYPKKRAKDAAERAWSKLRAEDRRLALNRLPAFVACRQWQANGGQYIPHASTWLNSGDWKELPDAALPAAPRGAISRLAMLEVD